MIHLGGYIGRIVEHTMTVINNKVAIRVLFEVDSCDDTIDALIWLTEKGFGMARASLKVCGFDVDKESLSLLEDNPTYLAGKTVPIVVEEYNGRMRASIVLNAKPTKTQIEKIEKGLREVKKSSSPSPSPEEEELPF